MEVIDISFFHLMVEKYGIPNLMFKSDEIIKSTEKHLPLEAENEVLVKSTKRTVKECTFEENPLFIIWNRQSYKIDVQITYERKNTSISIGLKK